MTALADATDPRFTDDQRATLARFESAPTPPEVQEARVVEEVARAICESDGEVWLGDHGAFCEDYRANAAAAVAAYRAAQDGGAEEAVRRVEALAEELDERGDIEHAEWRQRGQAQSLGRRDAYETSAELIRAALTPQAGDGAR